MPRIPIYTAEPQGQVPRTPDYIPAGDYPDIGKPIAQLAGPLVQLGARLGEKQDQIEASTMIGDYEAGVLQIRQELDHDPASQDNPAAYGKMFQERATDLRKKILDNAKSSGGSAYFDNYLRAHYPRDVIEANGQGLKLFTATQLAIFAGQENRMANDAATAVAAGDLPRAKEIEDQHTALVTSLATPDAATGRPGLMNAAEAIKHTQQFKIQVQEKSMVVLATTDPSKMRRLFAAGAFPDVPVEKSAAILETGRRWQEHQDNLADKMSKQKREDYFFANLGVANQGGLSEALIQNGLQGLDPVEPDPRRWATIKKLNDEQPNSSGTQAFHVIRQEYLKTRGTDEDIDKALAQTVQALDDLGHPNPEATKLLNELQSDRFRARSVNASEAAAGRARETQGFREAAAGRASREDIVRRALTEYDAWAGPLPVLGLQRKREADARALDKRKIEDLIRNEGFSQADALNSVKEKRTPNRAGQPQAPRQNTPNAIVPPPQKDVDKRLNDAIDALPGR